MEDRMAKLEEPKFKQVDLGRNAPLADLDPLIKAGNRLFEGWMAVGNEMLEFGKSRLDQNIEIGRAIARSTSLSEAIDLQARYARTIMQDYVSEASKIADLGTRSVLDSLTVWQQTSHPPIEHAAAAE